MRKIVAVTVLLALVLSFASCGSDNNNNKTEPTATPEENTVNIATATELRKFALDLNSNEADYSGYVINITADIDLGNEPWTPINTVCLFNSVIEGNGHTISNVNITGEKGQSQLGFFGEVSRMMSIKNLRFKTVRITALGKHAGGVIGEVRATSVLLDRVSMEDLVIDGGIGAPNDTTDICFRIGGLIGAVMEGSAEPTVIGCTVMNIKLKGYHNLAALIGSEQSGNITARDNQVSDIELNYSCGYSENYDAEKSRTFNEIFYNAVDWSDHSEIDELNGNTFSDVTLNDIVYNKTYLGYEGKQQK